MYVHLQAGVFGSLVKIRLNKETYSQMLWYEVHVPTYICSLIMLETINSN